ncbi:cisplatin damage response ATP-dependent DNA ligase [Pedomonas mirosovicensis]|uniref:cisplatin damage response ATP-dependent DNA ligase n=1 Tax=Pedomonas mirosovicensis TaxID=2908641 RepID=UPI0021692894|nr:cisplatin damage response ATP-dependent DNA ligase [Pedomonas mirosovicensis]MCH8683737.1 cisplatin damage response ATP-dependent DNA ligase [Pedomonas mirosovicensis]
MERFAHLLDRLVYTPSRNGKIALIADYLKSEPDPDRGWGLAALTGDLKIPAVKPALIRALLLERTDPVLFDLSYDYVGDLAETCALLWPTHTPGNAPLGLADTVTTLQRLSRAEAPAELARLLDRLDSSGRYALIKLATGGMRVGLSARLAKTGFAEAFGVELETLEELWHGLAPPYPDLFEWAEGKAPLPEVGETAVFRPFMLATPLEEGETLDLREFLAEWKWDGIRVQAVSIGGTKRLYSRTGDDISGAFPEIIENLTTEAALDGELLVRGNEGDPASFNALQQRLNRKTVDAKLLRSHPAFIRLYDILVDGSEDLRPLPLVQRRERLLAVAERLPGEFFDTSPLVEAKDWEALAEVRAAARGHDIEGLMLKRRDSPYTGGRQKGLWFKWKRDPLTADCVLMYAQRGHGKRSSFYSDYTFGAWGQDGQLLPVGKAYFGFTDEELKWLDRWVRGHTLKRFGPVREVEKALVLEVAFDSIHVSNRHKSGLAMRFPRISRIRTDKPAREADHIETLRSLAR